ncbi:proteasome component (PCI) domain protein [Actinidia rufa]|uniref:COP9 signalosome complex subunit 3 n=1 Tax=Actinidia rufa TaxID=165716 RepID=A0A7J0EP44_9ERIC|nr:proteasome component (PCI) domain protein [Actinidia rufa]
MNLNINSVESVVAQIQGLSSSADDVTHLHGLLKQSEELLQSESTRLAPFLAELDPSKHSLGYLYILEACTTAPNAKEQANELVLSIARFLNDCAAEQIHLAPDKFVSVCKRFKDHVMVLETPMRGVAPLLTAIRKLQSSSSEHLTSLHPDFLLLCLLAKCYKTGLCVLEHDIFEVLQGQQGTMIIHIWHLDRGMICIGQKRYRKALELLHNVVTAPMSTINAIAVEAYKKYILISLIHLGQPYIELVTCYGNGKISELEAYVQANREKFEISKLKLYPKIKAHLMVNPVLNPWWGRKRQEEMQFDFCGGISFPPPILPKPMIKTHIMDLNLGLVKQVVLSMYKQNIQRLTQTYLTLSLQDIANTVQLNSPKEAEMHVLQMIQDGEIYATINQKDGMVRFLEDPEQYKTCEMIEQIDSSIQRIMMLSKKLTAMDEHMSCDSQYLAKAGRERQRFDFDDFDTVPQKFNI